MTIIIIIILCDAREMHVNIRPYEKKYVKHCSVVPRGCGCATPNVEVEVADSRHALALNIMDQD